MENISIPLGPLAREAALKVILERFETGPTEDRLAYHKRHHTVGVIRRALNIALAMALAETKRTLVEIAAAWHDSIQVWRPDVRGNGAVFRSRFVGTNEGGSNHEAVAWMKSVPGLPFSDEDYQLVRAAIMVTVPAWDSEHGTTIQPALTPQSHPVVRAVALADLGAAGMEPTLFAMEGDQLFVEEQLDIVEAIQKARSPGDISFVTQELYRERYRLWTNSQVQFARGRRALLWSELRGLDGAAWRRVIKLFSHFDESIRLAKRDAERASKLTFEQMARQLVPTAFLKVA
jgi:hypothetical protein